MHLVGLQEAIALRHRKYQRCLLQLSERQKFSHLNKSLQGSVASYANTCTSTRISQKICSFTTVDTFCMF